MRYLTTDIAEKIFNQALTNGQADREKATIFYVNAILEDRLNLLQTNFPSNTLHAIAIKTNNHLGVLKHIVSLGHGLEAASLEEVKLALEAGAQNEKIVFDSPVKTQEEIDFCVANCSGMFVNANCLEELDRYPEKHNLRLGLRINPLVQNDAEGLFDVSTSTSKFGVPIAKEKEIIDACLKHNITTIHFHIGSGIKDFSANIRATEKIVQLAKSIDATRQKQGINTRITTIDIGGGIQFDLDDSSHSVKTFCDSLNLIEGVADYDLITEYGAFIHQDASFVVSKVEYVIDNGSEVPKTAYLHVGADLFLRRAYSSLNIHYPYSIVGKSNKPVTDKYNIVGPLCFSGDVLYKDLDLPALNAGDYFVMYNTGANTFSMWSGHCSREKTRFVIV